MKTKRIFSNLLTLGVALAFAFSCADDEAVTYSYRDASDRITGFNSDVSGAGASLTMSGSQMDKVDRIFIGNLVVPSKTFTNVSESSLTFKVPTSVGLGENDVLVVWPGPDRGNTKIQIVALPAITTFVPYTAATGETITLTGSNLNIVSGVKIGDVSATIASQSAGVLKVTVPAGIVTGKIILNSPAGDVSSANDLISCSANPTTSDCPDGLNLNTGFELGTGDNFDNWSKFNGGTFMVATTAVGEVYRGARALKVIRDGSLSSGQWRIQLASDLVTTEIGASYTVYMWAKASTAGGSLRVSTSPNALYTGDQAVPTTWTRLAFTFAAANEASTRVVLDLNGNESAVTTFFIDDVKLVKN